MEAALDTYKTPPHCRHCTSGQRRQHSSEMSRWSAAEQRPAGPPLFTLLIGLLAAGRTGASSDTETVLLRDLDFLDRLTNPCQIGVPECNGLHLDSQPQISDISGLPRRQALLEMFRVFLSETAHLHLMRQEILESHHTCGNESLRLVEDVFSLAGLLQNILCVITESLPSRLLQPVLEGISDLTLHKFRDCPRRLMRNCLVLENTSDMLSLSLQYMLESEAGQANFLQPRLIRHNPRLRVD
ncbi:uncharacterized protein LOC119106896 [Pollicipes pollicipes]|uniref:uncharacterized protein LOC119094230 n=1 Tax=Pollicipes pollicipes TaxID=41117 RepID=UPI001885087F|nr:uncharacterized protein LOC119094230 [Pollicipes pollicipes]XP_037086134.1 uncharacterized protein LOC119106896 [Pollicipes pollicipes]